MNDPSAAFNAPPPRYLLESDSSDEEGQGGYAGEAERRHKSRAQSPTPAARIIGFSSKAFSEAIIGVGQAGRYMYRKFGLPTTGGAEIQIGDRVIGRATEVGGAVVVCVEELDGEEAWAAVKGLSESVQAGRWTIFTSYLPSTYIALTPAARSAEPPIRSFGTASKSAQAKWEAPNHLTGVAAALATTAAHPAFPSMSIETTSTLILPLPLSSIRSDALASALSDASPNLPLDVTSTSSKTRWTETDDEPFSAPGMGRRATKWGKGAGGARDLSGVEGMYM